MNSNTVLGKIMTLLSMENKEVKLTVARLADGTLVESPTFDVGESLEVIHEDASKTEKMLKSKQNLRRKNQK
jgi:hypothetical protein